MKDISKFKEELIKKFSDSTLARVLMQEPDQLTDSEFQAKIGTWLNLADLEIKAR